ncbi:MAG: hypothetical protein JXM70_02670 [Pirellulales bacterium]|nr:hypothetical protein [Pirellulales bacterium]
MSTFLENPYPVLVVGVLALAFLFAMFYNLQKKVLLIPIVVVLVLTIGGVLIEQVVVTEREEVEATIDQIAAALRANDAPAVLSHLSSSAYESRRRAEWALERIQVNDAKVSGLEITINSLTSPPSAKATFTGVIKFDDRKQEFPYQSYMSKFTITLRKEGDRWMVTGHEEASQAGR